MQRRRIEPVGQCTCCTIHETKIPETFPYDPFHLLAWNASLRYCNQCGLPQDSSMASSSIPPGTLPSFSSFSRRAISCRLFAFLISFSTFLRSLSVSLTRDILSPLLCVGAVVEAAESVARDLMLRICHELASYLNKMTRTQDL